MRAAAAHGLQVVGLLVVGAGLLAGLARGDVRLELLLLAIGGAAFVAGRALAKGGAEG